MTLFYNITRQQVNYIHDFIFDAFFFKDNSSMIVPHFEFIFKFQEKPFEVLDLNVFTPLSLMFY